MCNCFFSVPVLFATSDGLYCRVVDGGGDMMRKRSTTSGGGGRESTPPTVNSSLNRESGALANWTQEEPKFYTEFCDIQRSVVLSAGVASSTKRFRHSVITEETEEDLVEDARTSGMFYFTSRKAG